MNATEQIGSAKFAELSSVVTEALERLRVPGAAVGVFYDGVEYTAGFGFTNINHPLTVDDQTLFQIASISKTFTATIAMRLVEQGKLSLDEPLKTYLPDLKLKDTEANEKATLRHVFTHNGGWVGDYFGDYGRGDDALAQNVAGMADLTQLTPLGQTYSYNNSGYAIAGRVIEVVTGKSFEAAAQELVLAPLGLEHTFYFPEEAITHRFSVGHQVHFDESTPTEILKPWALSRTSAALGGLITDVKDLLRYARFQMGDGSWQTPDGETVQLLKPETIQMMQSKQAQGASKNEGVGIAWMLRQAGDIRVIGHSGASNGQMSLLQIAPDKKFAITVVTNATSGTILCGEIARWAFENYLGVPAVAAEPLTMTSEELSQYTGEFKAVLSKNTIELKDGELYLQLTSLGGFPKPDSPASPTPPPTRLAFIGPDEAMALDYPFKGSLAVFLRDAGGAIEWVRFGGRIHKKQ